MLGNSFQDTLTISPLGEDTYLIESVEHSDISVFHSALKECPARKKDSGLGRARQLLVHFEGAEIVNLSEIKEHKPSVIKLEASSLTESNEKLWLLSYTYVKNNCVSDLIFWSKVDLFNKSPENLAFLNNLESFSMEIIDK